MEGSAAHERRGASQSGGGEQWGSRATRQAAKARPFAGNSATHAQCRRCPNSCACVGIKRQPTCGVPPAVDSDSGGESGLLSPSPSPRAPTEMRPLLTWLAGGCPFDRRRCTCGAPLATGLGRREQPLLTWLAGGFPFGREEDLVARGADAGVLPDPHVYARAHAARVPSVQLTLAP